MGLIELTESDEAFFINGDEAQGFVCEENLGALVLHRPIYGAISGSAMRRFYLKDDQPILYVEYRNSISGELMSIELGKVSDLDAAQAWIDRVNVLYEETKKP